LRLATGSAKERQNAEIFRRRSAVASDQALILILWPPLLPD
jgi:hypothetical protein